MSTVNPLSLKPRIARGSNTATTGNTVANSATAAASANNNNKENTGGNDSKNAASALQVTTDSVDRESLKAPTIDPLKTVRCLYGLSPPEAKELCRQPDGTAALKKELDKRKAAYIRVVLSVAPCLGMTHGNLAMQGEVWNTLSELPYQDRFLLYGAWRGHSMEKQALRHKHPHIVVAEVRARRLADSSWNHSHDFFAELQIRYRN